MTDHLNEGILNAWINGSMSDRETLALEDHISSCSKCKETADEIKWITQVFAGFPEVSVDRNLVEQTTQAWRKDRWKSGISLASSLQIRVSELSRPIAIALVSLGLIFGFLLGDMTNLVIDADTNRSIFYAVNNPDEESTVSDLYLNFLMTDNGSDL